MACLRNKYHGYIVVIGAFITHFTLGSFYTYGNIQPYIVSYMQNQSLSTDISAGSSIWIFGLLAFGFGSSITLGGYIQEKIGPKFTVLLGGWIMSFNVAMTYFTLKTYLSVVALSNGLIAGIGMGLAYGVSLGAPCQWFPNNKGLVSGIILSGFGLSAGLFNEIQTRYINTSIKEVWKNDRLRFSYLILAGIYAILQFIGSMLIKLPSDETSDSRGKDDLSLKIENVSHDLESISMNVDRKPHHLIMELDFWVLWLTFALNGSCLVLIFSLFKQFGVQIEEKSASDHRLTMISSLSAIFNCLGRLFWGFLNDKISYKITMLMMTLSSAAFFGTFFLCTKIDNTYGRLTMYSIWVFAFAFVLPGSFAVFPSVCGKLFGTRYLVPNYGFLYTSASVGYIITSVVTTVLWLPEENKISYNYAFICGAVMSILAAGVTIAFRGKSLIYRNHAG